ncbi:Rhodanese-like domain-containing protein [Crepidotus variabilis]|uniref:Rhodanese-like domain-containing protein n=1 Tax=Crepidotus variabilis TaxID=179855 RepID=A0A9P6EA16_9AGAR|nr:Rhodanese-like domain-containing protein [Crepidotus variabilis]
MTQTVRYIEGKELAELMKSGKTPHKDYVVVDVRDEDFVGGNIKGAINEPSQVFLHNVDGLVKQTREVPLVIFHCALSQVRGPKAARIYAETRENVLKGNDISHEVAILRDGFTEFQVKYKDDSELVENWDKEVWNPSWAMGPNQY